MDAVGAYRVFSNFCADINASNLLPLQENSVWNFASCSGEEAKEIKKRYTVTGTSVLGITFKDGVVICADNLGSYGSFAYFYNCARVVKINERIILGADGSYSDFQFISSIAQQKALCEEIFDDGFYIKPKALNSWLTRVFYQRRSGYDPLRNTLVVGGMQDGKPFLAQIDKFGSSFECSSIATGCGAYLAQPTLRDALMRNPKPSEDEAKHLLHQCMTILCCRDARSFHKYTVAVANMKGTRIEGPIKVEPDWKIAYMTEGHE